MKISICKCNNIQHPFPVFAWAIMFLQGMFPWKKNAWSHMAIKVTDNKGDTFFADANSKGCMLREEKLFYKQYSVLEEHKLKDSPKLETFMEWYWKLNGNEYDWKQICGLLFKILGFKKFNHSGNNYEKLICCELIINYLSVMNNLEVVDSDNYDLVTTWKIAKGY